LQPIAPYVLKANELQTFMNILTSLKVPTYYSGAFAKHITDKKIGYMKSHDWHICIDATDFATSLERIDLMPY
jgi:hypothetical protein